MRSKHSFALISTAAVALAACSTSSAGPSSGAPSVSAPTQVAVATLTVTAVPVASPTPSSAPAGESPAGSPAGGGGAQPTPGAIDPCSLLTPDEASKAIGKKLSAGVSATLDPDRVCTFKSGLTELKVFLAPPAPDAATAQAYWDAARAEVPSDIPVKDLPDFDRSAYGSGSAAGVSLSGLFVIDGTNFFEVYCGFPACTEAASLGAATLIAGRLP